MPALKTAQAATEYGRTPVASKVPEITVVFWVLKLLTTAMGENASDYLMHINEYAAVTIGAVGFVGLLCWQVRTVQFRPSPYWAAVSMVAVVGTMAADLLHGRLGVPLWASTLAYAVALACTFVAWYRSEKTLSIHAITTRRREVFYWLTVSFTFALGTAAGDLTADTLGLGFLGSIVLFAVVMAVPLIGRWALRLNAVVAFWLAYVVTRPLGASIADWLGKPARAGGVGLGDGPVAAALISAIIVIVAVVAIRRPSPSRNGTSSD